MVSSRRAGAFALALTSLACARVSAPVVASTPEPTPELGAEVETDPLRWLEVVVADGRICATDERELSWCWQVHGLELEPVPVQLRRSQRVYTTCGPGLSLRDRVAMLDEELPSEVNEADCELWEGGRLSCRVAGGASTIELVVPEAGPEPTLIVEVVEGLGIGSGSWASLTILSPLSPVPELHSRLNDRFHPLFAPYALDLASVDLVYARPKVLRP